VAGKVHFIAARESGCFPPREEASVGWGEAMKLYRINKLSRPNGPIVKKKDVLARTDAQAVIDAAESDDCPVCEVLRDGQRVGSIQ
jgi:hypothetical protein